MKGEFNKIVNICNNIEPIIKVDKKGYIPITAILTYSHYINENKCTPCCDFLTRNNKMEWISIDDELPLKEYRDENIFCDYLVTVYPKDLNACEDAHVLILYFQADKDYFSHSPGGVPYENEHSHFITHWAEKPIPAIITLRDK